MENHTESLLENIHIPADLRKLSIDELPELCKQLRQYIIDIVSVNGGHFAASLGVVELTVAMHYVFDTPYDQLVWDVGHQAYGHKILTGRRDQFHTNRIFGGLSGFPKRSESEYDTFGVGHSSTSISAALGMAVASKLKGEEHRQHIAVIGDGAMTAGLAFEGLNHAGIENSNVIVVLNDNCMSIDPNVGALKEYLTSMTTSRPYNRFKDDVAYVLNGIKKIGGPDALKYAKKLEKSIKGSILKQSNLFEALKFRYFGPTDGHDVKKLVHVFQDLKNIPGPKLLHCITVKGKGFELAEKDQTLWHAPGLFDKYTGEIQKKVSLEPQPPKYQDVFGHTLLELAEANAKIVGVTPAMPSGCSMNIMMKAMPKRAFDVGIAEQHAVTFSAGMATQGLIPFCNIYSSFMQRAYDQVIHDVALQNLNVVFCLDRAGLVGADGATHHGAYDVAFMRCIPQINIASPMDEIELRNLMYTAQLPNKGTFVIRYPRGNGVMVNWKQPFEEIQIGKGRIITEGSDVAILTLGHVGNFAVQACKTLQQQGLTPGHFDMRFVKPIDAEMLHHICKNYKYLITVEDGCIEGGMGSAVLEFMSENGYSNPLKRLGIPDEFIEHGEQKQLWDLCKYDTHAIVNQVRSFVQNEVIIS